MSSEIGEGFLFLNSAKEIQNSLAQIYSEKENFARIYQFQQDITRMSKGKKHFHLYLSILKSMGDELQQHHLQTTSGETIKKQVENDKMFKLLVGLGIDYENVWCSILNNICTTIQREETRKKVRAKKIQRKKGKDLRVVALQTKSMSTTGKEKISSTYCKKIGCHRDNCWSFHGRPMNLGGRSNRGRNSYKPWRHQEDNSNNIRMIMKFQN